MTGAGSYGFKVALILEALGGSRNHAQPLSVSLQFVRERARLGRLGCVKKILRKIES